MNSQVRKCLLAIGVVVFATPVIDAQSTQPQRSTQPQQAKAPSSQFSPSAVPVGVRPRNPYSQTVNPHERSQRQSSTQSAGQPKRMTPSQYQQLMAPQNRRVTQPQSGSTRAANRTNSTPPRTYRLSDSNGPNLNVAGQTNNPAYRITHANQIQRTSFNRNVKQDDEEPVVPEVLRGKKSAAKSAAKSGSTSKSAAGQQPVGQPNATLPNLPARQDNTTPPKITTLDLPSFSPAANTVPTRTRTAKLPNLAPAKTNAGGALPELPTLPQRQTTLELPNAHTGHRPGASSSFSAKAALPSLQPQPSPSHFPATSLPSTQLRTQQDFTPAKQFPTFDSSPAKLPPARVKAPSRPAFNQSATSSTNARTTSNRRELGSAALPVIEVETIGPQTISKGKQSTYNVKIHNRSQLAAERIVLKLEVPKHIELVNIVTSSGHRDTIGQAGKQMIQWNVASLAAGQTTQMKIDLIPKRAEPLNMNVSWTMEPRSTTTQIHVTEPKLAMIIAGPTDVQFGSKAIYTVTVQNTGTGLAEDIKVRLSEALGGARAPLGHIPAGQKKQFQVELLARSPGRLELVASAVGLGELRTSASKQVMVRRAKLDVAMAAPKLKYAGTVASYDVVVANRGDAVAKNVVASISLPMGVKYLSGINSAKVERNQLKWTIGHLSPGDQRRFRVHCQLNASGNVKVDIGVTGAADLMAATSAITLVETIADLVLTVEDPKGPLPTGESVTYTIRIKNRGTRSANQVNLVMHFADGIEPTGAQGLTYKTLPGEVNFSPISSIDPGNEVVVKVTAKAFQPGNHTFRAQLKCFLEPRSLGHFLSQPFIWRKRTTEPNDPTGPRHHLQLLLCPVWGNISVLDQ